MNLPSPLIRLHPEDNVLVARQPLALGQSLPEFGVKARAQVPAGHKIAARAIAEGWTEKDGKLPVNPSGGLKSKGHPIGATGVSMHIMASLQLMGEAGGMQIEGAKLAGVFNMGGAAVANYVSILERLR